MPVLNGPLAICLDLSVVGDNVDGFGILLP